MRNSVFASLALILIGAIALIVYGSTRPRAQAFHGKLADLLPEAPQGWTRTLRPIADTPEMQKAVGEILNFDDGVFVDYTCGAERLSVYIAYWSPGKMSHRLVAGHTPDVCWTLAGWSCDARGTVVGQTENGSRLPKAETRTFTALGNIEYVWFWHMIGGKPKSYGNGAEPPWYASLTDMLAKGLNQREEQFFIRLSSPQPLDNPALVPVLEPVLYTLPLHAKEAGILYHKN